MERHFVHELEALKKSLISMCSLAEQAIAASIGALLERQPETARRVIAEDERINLLELEVDEMVVDILALHQPVAVDLRLILAAAKISNDLERIGDHAVNIAESALKYNEQPAVKPFVDIPQMAEITKTMLRDTIDAFIHSDAKLARRVLKNDDEIDALNRKVVAEMISLMRSDASAIEQALELIRVSRNLERVADLATNIAEDVVFMAEAHVVKHRFEERGKSRG